MRYYNRYQDFLLNGEQTVVPFVNIPSKPTDKKFIYRVSFKYTTYNFFNLFYILKD